MFFQLYKFQLIQNGKFANIITDKSKILNIFHKLS